MVMNTEVKRNSPDAGGFFLKGFLFLLDHSFFLRQC